MKKVFLISLAIAIVAVNGVLLYGCYKEHSQRKNVEKDLTQCNKDVDTLETDKEKLQQDIETLNSDKEKLQKEKATLESKKKKLEQEVADLKKE